MSKIDISEEGSTELTDLLVCPYCGHVNVDGWELTEDDGETACNSCGKDFHYVREISVTYSTGKLK